MFFHIWDKRILLMQLIWRPPSSRFTAVTRLYDSSGCQCSSHNRFKLAARGSTRVIVPVVSSFVNRAHVIMDSYEFRAAGLCLHKQIRTCINCDGGWPRATSVMPSWAENGRINIGWCRNLVCHGWWGHSWLMDATLCKTEGLYDLRKETLFLNFCI